MDDPLIKTISENPEILKMLNEKIQNDVEQKQEVNLLEQKILEMEELNE